MPTRRETVVTLDGDVLDAGLPIVHADDPMVLRGDGVFETLLIRGGRACLLDAHLARLARSAAIIGLPAPDLPRWRSAVAVAIALASGQDDVDAVLRLSYGRGRTGGPTAFLTVSDLPERVLANRRDGVSAMTLDRGVAADAGDRPWSIAGAKSLSYATNAAALRHAASLDFDDVILVGTDGTVLEGPRSSVVVADQAGVLVTPPSTLPILAGTTVRAVFEAARGRGRTCEERVLRITDLHAAQGIWLLSSVTLAARVHTLDGVTVPAGPAAAGMAGLVDAAVSGEL